MLETVKVKDISVPQLNNCLSTSTSQVLNTVGHSYENVTMSSGQKFELQTCD